MTDKKSMVLRLDQELADRLAAVAEVEGRAISDVVREAIATHVERRRKDPKFQKMLEDNIVRHGRMLRLLRMTEK